MLGFPLASSLRRCRCCEGPSSGVTAADVRSAGDSSLGILTVVLEGPVKELDTISQYFWLPLDPFSPDSEQRQISPSNINAYLTPEVMRIMDICMTQVKFS